MAGFSNLIHGQGPLSTAWSLGNGLVRSVPKNSRIYKEALNDNVKELCEEVVKLTTDVPPMDACQVSVLFLGLNKMYAIQLEAFRGRLAEMYSSLRCHIPSSLATSIDLPRETQRRQNIDVCLPLDPVEGFGEFSFNALEDPLDYGGDCQNQRPGSSLNNSTNLDLRELTTAGSNLIESLHHGDADCHDGYLDDDAVINLLGSSQTVSNQADITLRDDVNILQPEVQVEDPENYFFGDFEDENEMDVESGLELPSAGVEIDEPPAMDEQVLVPEAVETGSVSTAAMETEAVTPVKEPPSRRVMMSPMNLRKRDASDEAAYKEYKPKRRRPKGFYLKKDEHLEIPVIGDELEGQPSVPTTPVRGRRLETTVSASPAKHLEPSPAKFFEDTSALFGRLHGRRLTQMTFDIQARPPLQETLEAEAMRKEGLSVTGDGGGGGSVNQPSIAGIASDTSVGLGHVTSDDKGPASSVEELTLPDPNLGTPERSWSPFENATCEDEGAILVEAIPSPISHLYNDISTHEQPTATHEGEEIPVERETTHSREAPEQLTPAQQQHLETPVEPPRTPAPVFERHGLPRIFQSLHPPPTTTKLKAGFEFGRFLTSEGQEGGAGTESVLRTSADLSAHSSPIISAQFELHAESYMAAIQSQHPIFDEAFNHVLNCPTSCSTAKFPIRHRTGLEHLSNKMRRQASARKFHPHLLYLETVTAPLETLKSSAV